MVKSYFPGWPWVRVIGQKRRGSIAPIFAVMAIPVALSVGVGVDMTRLTLARADLQSAVDGAALAGATAAGTQSAINAGATANTVATSYFNASSQGPSVAITPQNPRATSATTSSGYNVTVSASGTMKTAFMGIANLLGAGDFRTVNISAQATASNPVIPGSPSQQAQPVVSTGNQDAYAWDFNSAYLYAVPTDPDGTPHYDQYPPFSQFYEIATNCNQTSAVWSNKSRCNGQPGATINSSQVFPAVASNQPLAILLVNMTDGLIQPIDNGNGNNGNGGNGNQYNCSENDYNGDKSKKKDGYGCNSYGAPPGNWQLFTTATMSLGQPPSQVTDNTVNLVEQITGGMFSVRATNKPTNYNSINQQSLNNCLLEIQQVDPNKIYSDPPVTNVCFSSTDPNDLTSGKQFANLSCDQMAGRTFMYWFDDMGGNWDDHDYKNIVFHLRCVPGATNPNGGTIGSGSTNTTAKPTVSLLR